MLIKLDRSTIRETRWYEYVLRFLFGGLISAAAGVIAQHFGPSVGGLFLAFPAIFPASATLIESHEREKKQQKGLNGEQRGRDAAALEALGSAFGSIGLIVFAVLVWLLLPRYSPPIVIACATAAWIAVGAGIWTLRKKSVAFRRQARYAGVGKQP
jgi:Co/Zn/Cd efflux system component